jgi:hypothetical protein
MPRDPRKDVLYQRDRRLSEPPANITYRSPKGSSEQRNGDQANPSDPQRPSSPRRTEPPVQT